MFKLVYSTRLYSNIVFIVVGVFRKRLSNEENKHIKVIVSRGRSITFVLFT